MPTTPLLSDRPIAAPEPDLRSALLSARHNHAFWSSQAASDLLRYAEASLRPIALRTQADPSDALSHAYEIWATLPLSTVEDPTTDLWAYTRAAVRRSLDREDEAARKATSTAGIRRDSARYFEGFTSLDDIELGYTQATDHDDDDTETPLDVRSANAMSALEQVLVLAGFDEDQRVSLVDVIADIVTTSPSVRASIARAESVRELFEPQLSEAQWKSLIEVILGTPAGKPGILELAGAGHPAPAMEAHVSNRLMNVLAVAA
jgi:hypothetical protein